MTEDLIERLEARLALAEQHGPIGESREVYIPSSWLPDILSALRERGGGDRIGTHAEGCWSWGPRHYECAVREIERLSALRGEQWQGIETAPEGVAVLIGGDWPDGDPWWAVGERMGNFWTTAANADPTRWRLLPPPPKGTSHE